MNNQTKWQRYPRTAFAFFLALIMTFGGVPLTALAEPEGEFLEPEGQQTEGIESLPQLIVAQEEAWESGAIGGDDNDELLDGYLQQRVAELLPDSAEERPASESRAIGAKSVQGVLTGNDLVVYDTLRPLIQEVAEGTRQSAVFEIPLSSLGYDGPWSAAELGLETVISNNSISQEAMQAAYNKVSFDFSTVMRALMADCPYDLYWFDKTAGFGRMGQSFNATWQDGEYRVGLDGNPRVYMYVASEYSATGNRETTDVGPHVQAVNTAVSNASAIVTSNQNKTVLDRLQSYKDAICEATSYNSAAADDEIDTPYGNPWQLIWVFDGDDETTVVCEGYSKAFKYLCDLTWPDPSVAPFECLLVSGVMSGGTGSGAHMWNIMRMDDGNSYLVDVTNCDEGTAGYPNELFMAYGPSGDYWNGYTFDANGQSIGYVYDNYAKQFYSEEELTISSTEYEALAPVQKTSIEGASVTVADSVVYDGTAQEPEPVVTLDGTVLQRDVDYTCSYGNNVNAGTATLTIAGAGDYEGEVSVTFQITPANVSSALVTLGATSVVYDGSPKTPLASVSLDGVALQVGTDYAVSYRSNVDVGTATAVVTGTGNYAGEASAAFRIRPASISGAKLALSATSLAYTGGVRRPAVKSVGGRSLRAGSDYAVSYSASSPVAVGTYQVWAEGRGNYGGTSARAGYDVVPKATSLTKLAPAKSALAATWRSQLLQCDGYQLQVSADRSFSAPRVVTVAGASATSRKVTGLKSKAAYYVRVRTCKTVGGRTYYGAWSAAQSAATL